MVQREMECGRSPLASRARASTGRAGRSKATPTGMRKQRAETATGFKGDQGRARRQRLILEAKSQLAGKRRILKPRYGANFNGMTRRASGQFRCSAVQMPPERWRAGPVGSTFE